MSTLRIGLIMNKLSLLQPLVWRILIGVAVTILIGSNLGTSVNAILGDADDWQQIGQSMPAQQNWTSYDVAQDGATTYVAFASPESDNKATVKKLIGNDWVAVGQPNFTERSASFTKSVFADRGLVIHNHTPYLIYLDYDSLDTSNQRLAVMKFDGVNWVTVGPYINNVIDAQVSLVFVGTIPHIAYKVAGGPQIKQLSGSTWEDVGSLPNDTCQPLTLQSVSNTLYATCTLGDGTLLVSQYTGAWTEIGRFNGVATANQRPILVQSGSSLLIVYTTASFSLHIKEYIDNVWVDAEAQPITDEVLSAPLSIETINSKVTLSYLGYNSSYESFQTVKTLDGDTWKLVGSPLRGVVALGISSLQNDLFISGNFTPNADNPSDFTIQTYRYRLAPSSANIVTFPNTTDGGAIELETPTGTALTCNAAQDENELTAQDNAYQYPLGLVDFCFTTEQNNNEVSLTFATDLTRNQVTARKYNPNTKQYSTVPDTTITDTTINGKHALKLTYTITDNGPLDLDPALGVIRDPVGLGVINDSILAPNTGVGRITTVPWTIGALIGVAAAISVSTVVIIVRKRQNQ